MTQLAINLVKLLKVHRKDPRGSEFVQIPISPPIPPYEFFFISVEGLTLDFHLDHGFQGKLSGSTAKFPKWISIFEPFGHSG